MSAAVVFAGGVDADSGELRVFDRTSGVPLAPRGRRELRGAAFA